MNVLDVLECDHFGDVLVSVSHIFIYIWTMVKLMFERFTVGISTVFAFSQIITTNFSLLGYYNTVLLYKGTFNFFAIELRLKKTN